MLTAGTGPPTDCQKIGRRLALTFLAMENQTCLKIYIQPIFDSVSGRPARMG